MLPKVYLYFYNNRLWDHLLYCLQRSKRFADI
jgi:hypothetical protein